ncbi:MAG TPA: DUF2007 domain-containing protein [Chitinophagaceae bacterium]
MEFVVIRRYDNYVAAHIDMGRLLEEEINCWLKDENTVTIDPILSNAIGGIKLMAAASQAERALSILRTLEAEQKSLNPCPKCGSKNIELISTPRKASNWITAIFGFLFANYAIAADKVNHCFDCGHEYAPVETEDEVQEA